MVDEARNAANRCTIRYLSSQELEERPLNCEACKNDIPSGSSFCPACGRRVMPSVVVGSSEIEPPQRNADRSYFWRTVGRVASIVALIGFTMPWISCGGVSTGIDLANRYEYVWFFPISMIAALVMLFTKPTSIEQMKKFYKYVAGCGVAATSIVVFFIAYLFWQLSQFDSELIKYVGIDMGIDFSILGSVTVALAGVKAYRAVTASASTPRHDSPPETTSAFPLIPK